MFPYPSGDLHMGHGEVFALADVIARYWFQQGYDVLHPVGWDSFGLPAENAAIKRNEHPADWTYKNIETQAESFRRYAISFDWSTRVCTPSDPEYYRWTQWLFLKLYENGLAYRKASPVNWCPNDQTVLANEQVVGGHCERCGAEVTKRDLTQWYFKVTDFAQRLLDDMDALKGKLARPGADHAAQLDRPLRGRPRRLRHRGPRSRRAGHGVHHAAGHPVRRDVLRGRGRRAAGRRAGAPTSSVEAFEEYLLQVQRTTEIERLTEGRDKTGVFLGVHAVNPANGRADARLRSRLRAGRLRHRRDHGRARAGPARLGLRHEVRPADRPHGAAA